MNMNPLEMFQALKNPKQYVMNMLQKNSNPMINNLVQMAEKGDTEGIENFGRNLYKQQGRNFDDEFGAFMSNFKN